MSYSAEIYNAAKAAIDRRYFSAINEAEERRKTFISICPEYDEIDSKISQTGARLARAIFNGRDISEIRAENQRLQRKRRDLLTKYVVKIEDLEPRHFCEKCGDKGMVNGKLCDCLINEMRRIKYEQINGTLPLAESTFDTFCVDFYPEQAKNNPQISPRREMARVLERCRAYAENFSLSSPSLFFQGGVGLGKTHLSLAIAGEVIKRGCDVVYKSAISLFSQIESEKFSRNADENSLVAIKSCDLLILDDLGAEFVTQFSISVLYDVINTRLLERRPTIISTNLTTTLLMEKYTERLVSRIHGNFKRVAFVGEDLRIARKNQKRG